MLGYITSILVLTDVRSLLVLFLLLPQCGKGIS